MKIDVFELERIQSMYENKVEYNLSDTGVHPYTLKELFNNEEIAELAGQRLGYGHTNGDPGLREAIARLYPGADAANVLVTNGSAEANFIALWSLLEPGDELVLMQPNYMQIWGLARSFGAQVKTFHLMEEMDWGPSLEQLKEQITPRTKMIAVCNPNNPTGAVLSDLEMRWLFKLAEQVGAWIYADEIYRGAELDGKETPSFYGYSDYKKVIVNGGLSKAYGLPGIRIGWLAGPFDIIARAWACHDYTTISAGIVGQWVARRALQPGMREKILNRGREMLKENLNVLQQWTDRHNGLFRFVPPRAGAMAFIKHNLPMKSREFATRLRVEMGVFVIDGDCFGMDGYLRIGFGSEKEYLKAGLARIDEFLQSISL
ncbi:MAG: aminotransferase class I/II-fold pyridoxal phosphate-dependent enzyme [Candidatus Aminicenantes bacterium]|nr:aminotransferase class I/II-fold pyridoxal phosphate-dependent enzyme [Candidatus Aminicenantes bacterium]